MGELKLICFSDADWAGNLEDRSSTSGFAIYLGRNLISWCTKRQKCISLSIMEAEYVALSEAVKETIFIRKLLNEIGYNIETPLVYCDNLAAIEIAKNPKDNQRAKHIDLKFHFVRNAIKNNEIDLNYIKSKDNKADIFTKPLNSNLFNNNCQQIGIYKDV